jgi:hypothetical protein
LYTNFSLYFFACLLEKRHLSLSLSFTLTSYVTLFWLLTPSFWDDFNEIQEMVKPISPLPRYCSRYNIQFYNNQLLPAFKNFYLTTAEIKVMIFVSHIKKYFTLTNSKCLFLDRKENYSKFWSYLCFLLVFPYSIVTLCSLFVI